MEYIDIIQDNCANHSSVSWWPKFAFHCTDVTNAVSILESGVLYSRTKAEKLGVMNNDNASRQVIDITESGAKSSVRFYFRPLTPTQYYNEGYKHPQLRYDNDINANMPVPVFFLFNLARLISIKGVSFSEFPQSGHGAEHKDGINAFSKLDFDKIYSQGFNNLADVKKYRHAEILHPDSLQISTCLENVLCRNNVERSTLLNMLKERNYKKYKEYQSIIKICKKDMFENNGLFVTDFRYHENQMSISFSDTQEKKRYIQTMQEKNGALELKPVTVRITLRWMNGKSLIKQMNAETQIDYRTCTGLTYRIPNVQAAKELKVQVYFDDKLMCCAEQSVEESELIK